MSVPRYKEGEIVFVIDAGFDGECIKVGCVEENEEQYDSMDVRFETDPHNISSDQSRVVRVLPDQCLRVDASKYETLVRTGKTDIIDDEARMRVDVIIDILDEFEYGETNRSNILSGEFKLYVPRQHAIDVHDKIEQTGVWSVEYDSSVSDINILTAEYTGDS